MALHPRIRYREKMKTLSILASLLFLSSSVLANPASSPVPSESAPVNVVSAPKGAKVSFKNLKDGQTVAKKLTVKFGVSGMKIHPAGELVEGTGHHHLIIDGEPTPIGTVVVADATHIHFGKGQTETEIELAPGKHKLTLQFANGAHMSYGPSMSKTIEVTVKE